MIRPDRANVALVVAGGTNWPLPSCAAFGDVREGDAIAPSVFIIFRSCARRQNMASTEVQAARPDQRSRPLAVLARWLPPWLVVAAASLGLGLRFFLFIRDYSVNVLYFDQWGFLDPFFHGSPGFRELFFEQWGPHREGVGLIADKFLYPLTRWSVPAESYMIGACIFGAMLLALLLKRKLFGPLHFYDVVIPLLFLNLTQFETLIGTPNPSYGGFPLLMIMFYCLALLQRDRLLRYSLVLLLNFLLIYTGFGFFMGSVTVGVFALECFWVSRRWTSGTAVLPFAGLLIAALSLSSFFIHYKFWPAVPCFAVTPRYVSLYPEFMAGMFAYFIGPGGDKLPVIALGMAVLLALVTMLGVNVLRLARDGQRVEQHLIGGVLLGYALLFSGNTAVGRVCLGLDAAFAPRYMTLLIPAFLAAYFYLVSHPWRGKRPLVLGLFTALILPRAVHNPPAAKRYAEGKRNWASCYVRTEDISYCDRRGNFEIYPYPQKVKLKQKLNYLKEHRLNLFR